MFAVHFAAIVIVISMNERIEFGTWLIKLQRTNVDVVDGDAEDDGKDKRIHHPVEMKDK